MTVDPYAMIFFFFQAEDGIRDLYVTGVRRVLFRSRACHRIRSAWHHSRRRGDEGNRRDEAVGAGGAAGRADRFVSRARGRSGAGGRGESEAANRRDAGLHGGADRQRRDARGGRVPAVLQPGLRTLVSTSVASAPMSPGRNVGTCTSRPSSLTTAISSSGEQRSSCPDRATSIFGSASSL